MAKTYVYGMYGLGGRIWSAGIEDYVLSTIKRIPNTIVYPTKGYTEWQGIAASIKAQPKGSKSAVIGHSMGSGSATYVTDRVFVDLIVCYDTAGRYPSGIAKNCGKLLDFWDTAWTFVPKYRPWAYPGHAQKIKRTQVYTGHTKIPYSSGLLAKVMDEIDILVKS